MAFSGASARGRKPHVHGAAGVARLDLFLRQRRLGHARRCHAPHPAAACGAWTGPRRAPDAARVARAPRRAARCGHRGARRQRVAQRRLGVADGRTARRRFPDAGCVRAAARGLGGTAVARSPRARSAATPCLRGPADRLRRVGDATRHHQRRQGARKRLQRRGRGAGLSRHRVRRVPAPGFPADARRRAAARAENLRPRRAVELPRSVRRLDCRGLR